MLVAKHDAKAILKDKMIIVNFGKITVINDLSSVYNKLKEYYFGKVQDRI